MNPLYFVLALLTMVALASAQMLQVDSVSVDSIWNSDSTWAAGQRQSRDCKVSFRLQGAGYARIVADISIDSGKTWNFSPDSIFTVPFIGLLVKVGSKDSITVRILGKDRSGVVLRLIALQATPILALSSEKKLLLTLTPGQNVTAKFQCSIKWNTKGYCPAVQKVYWDASADGTIDDSTPNGHFNNPNDWAWQTTVPSDNQTRKVVVRAMDKNGLWSFPDTVTVKFGLLVDDLRRSIGWFLIPMVHSTIGYSEISLPMMPKKAAKARTIILRFNRCMISKRKPKITILTDNGMFPLKRYSWRTGPSTAFRVQPLMHHVKAF